MKLDKLSMGIKKPRTKGSGLKSNRYAKVEYPN